MTILHHWLFAFALTLLTELVIAVPILGKEGELSRRVAAVGLAQLATHPAVWFIWPLFGWPRPVYLLFAESFALVVETLIYRLVFPRLTWARVLAASALANGASLLVGAWLQ